jgi:hypothetical protein
MKVFLLVLLGIASISASSPIECNNDKDCAKCPSGSGICIRRNGNPLNMDNPSVRFCRCRPKPQLPQSTTVAPTKLTTQQQEGTTTKNRLVGLRGCPYGIVCAGFCQSYCSGLKICKQEKCSAIAYDYDNACHCVIWGSYTGDKWCHILKLLKKKSVKC